MNLIMFANIAAEIEVYRLDRVGIGKGTQEGIMVVMRIIH